MRPDDRGMQWHVRRRCDSATGAAAREEAMRPGDKGGALASYEGDRRSTTILSLY
jgi:hypothetical protein